MEEAERAIGGLKGAFVGNLVFSSAHEQLVIPPNVVIIGKVQSRQGTFDKQIKLVFASFGHLISFATSLGERFQCFELEEASFDGSVIRRSDICPQRTGE